MSNKIIETRTTTPDGDWVDMDGDGNPCVTCGACCSLLRVSFANAELDSAFNPDAGVPADLTVSVTPFRSAMRGTEFAQGACVALEGQPGKKVGCQIYSRRPTPCRLFEAWDKDGNPNPDCQRLRAKINLPPLSKR